MPNYKKRIFINTSFFNLNIQNVSQQSTATKLLLDFNWIDLKKEQDPFPGFAVKSKAPGKGCTGVAGWWIHPSFGQFGQSIRK